MPEFEETPLLPGPPLAERRIALISTAGLHRRGDRPFTEQSGDFRIISSDVADKDIVMSHISTNFDRLGFMQDVDVAFPINRLKELAEEGVIGSVAEFHFSFMGATPPDQMEPGVREIVQTLKADNVSAVALCPV
ncbi:MAG: selenoprotein B glycine/betaine/sarcosine/D-proline reductase [Rhodospirillaceae bacterium]|nr:selenoprotein B glycine/betaine/sarcosine/D-proline reductase [Rhodospirillaceae bacterium]